LHLSFKKSAMQAQNFINYLNFLKTFDKKKVPLAYEDALQKV